MIYVIIFYQKVSKDLKLDLNARQRKWIPEQDLMKSFGTLTQFGLKDALKEEIYRDSKEGIAKCQWWSTYKEEIGEIKPLDIEQDTKWK